MKKVTKNKSLIIMIVIFLIYSIIHSCTMIMVGDDFTWVDLYDIQDIFSFSSQNGRYFTNFLTKLIVNYPVARIIIMTVFTFIFPFIISSITDNGENRTINFSFAAASVLLIPGFILIDTLNWMSGFTNYVISAELTLLYILFCIPLLKGRALEKSPVWAVYTSVIGFLGALCVENITIYNICFGIFIGIYSLCRYKKLHIANITYIIFSVAGAVLMFLNQAYSSIIVAGNDDFGMRRVEFGTADIFQRVFADIIPMYSRKFYIFHVIIAISVVLLYHKKYKNNEAGKNPKYAKLFIPMIVIYAMYTFFAAVSGEFVSLTIARRFEAVETAFTFLYIIALLYIFYSIGNSTDSIRRSVYLISTIIVTAPFVAVSPVTPRCFYASYVFWGLLAAELAVSALSGINVPEMGKKLSVVMSSCMCLFYSYALVCNKYVDNDRINAIRGMMESNQRVIDIVILPYQSVNLDGVMIFFDKESENALLPDNSSWYQKAMCAYYGIDESIADKKYIVLSAYEYYE